jgi:hypothetical protein
MNIKYTQFSIVDDFRSKIKIVSQPQNDLFKLELGFTGDSLQIYKRMFWFFFFSYEKTFPQPFLFLFFILIRDIIKQKNNR